jgi:xanthine dehydrogenase accessory factor
MDDVKAVYQALLEAQLQGQAVALATVIDAQGSVPRHVGAKMLVRINGTTVGTVGGGALENLVLKEAQAALTDGQARTREYRLNDLRDGDPGICGGTVRVFIEAIGTSPTLLVIGGGHVGKALAELGKWAGYRVALSDDRPEFCNPQYIGGLDAYWLCQPAEVAQHITAQTYVAAVTRGLPIDLALIPALLNTPAPYLGVIGSRRRWVLTAEALQAQAGLTAAQLARIHAPIGLELQAETPHEIAISIMAEITMVRRGGTGKPMQYQVEETT